MENILNKKKMIILAILTLLILATFLNIFIRSFIEWGEERYWLIYYLLTVPIIASVLIFIYFPRYALWIRISFSFVILLCLFFGFYRVALLADSVNEGRVGNKIYPVVVRFEAIYLKMLGYEDQFLKYHIDKDYYASIVKTLNSCDKQAITNLINTEGARSPKNRNTAFVDNFLINFFKSNRCSAEVMNLVKQNSNKFY
jgi:hypothetical protein